MGWCIQPHSLPTLAHSLHTKLCNRRKRQIQYEIMENRIGLPSNNATLTFAMAKVHLLSTYEVYNYWPGLLLFSWAWLVQTIDASKYIVLTRDYQNLSCQLNLIRICLRRSNLERGNWIESAVVAQLLHCTSFTFVIKLKGSIDKKCRPQFDHELDAFQTFNIHN